MEHVGEPYYVVLLTAVAYHGASHQKPQVFQVMVARRRRAIACGRVRVQFRSRADMAGTPVVTRNTPRGVLRIASPAATALEVAGYPGPCGGLDNVATVLAELAAALDPILAERRSFAVALDPSAPTAGSPSDRRWKIVVNADVEPET